LPFVLIVSSLAACDGGPSQPPEAFALQVAAAVAEGDWPAYRSMALAHAAALATESNPTATRATFSNLVDADDDRIRADFDRVVRSGAARARDVSGYRAIVDATETDRWHLHVEDASGRATGLRMTLQRFDDSYRVVHLYVR
jgi:hypothetical protein